MVTVKRARTAETLKPPNLRLRLRAPYFYPDYVHRGLRRFSGHGLARVRTEFALEVLLHNLLVLHRSLGQKHHVQASHLTTEDIAA